MLFDESHAFGRAWMPLIRRNSLSALPALVKRGTIRLCATTAATGAAAMAEPIELEIFTDYV